MFICIAIRLVYFFVGYILIVIIFHGRYKKVLHSSINNLFEENNFFSSFFNYEFPFICGPTNLSVCHGYSYLCSQREVVQIKYTSLFSRIIFFITDICYTERAWSCQPRRICNHRSVWWCSLWHCSPRQTVQGGCQPFRSCFSEVWSGQAWRTAKL